MNRILKRCPGITYKEYVVGMKFKHDDLFEGSGFKVKAIYERDRGFLIAVDVEDGASSCFISVDKEELQAEGRSIVSDDG